MKKLKIGILALLVLLAVFVLSSCDSVTVSRVYVNDEMHAIVEYSDGTTEDLGYVGVEVEKEVLPPKYTVTFLDAFGATLKSEKVYKGDGATAPEAPEIADKAFDRWDTDFSAVTGDLTVSPIYVAAAEYTVTFKDDTGTVLKTEKVIHGHAAIAPTTPAPRVDTIFEKWDKSFDEVKGDLTVTAVYRAKKTFTVTFKDYTGLVLGTARVKETETATAPVTPIREGYTFKEWTGGITNVTSDRTLTASYTLNEGDNLIDLASVLNADGTVTVTVSVVGNVNFAAFDCFISVPTGTTYTASDANCTMNIKDNVLGCSYSNAYGANGKTELFRFTFRPVDDEVTLQVNVDTMANTAGEDVRYTVLGKTICVK